jgi:MFS family permease
MIERREHLEHFMCVIIWQGLGFLVAVIVFGCSLVANLILNATVGDGYYDHHKWPFAVSLIFSAAICWFLGNYLRTRSDRIAIDKETGKEFVVNQSRHTLFFIPMHYWSPILLLIALILFGIEFLR